MIRSILLPAIVLFFSALCACGGKDPGTARTPLVTVTPAPVQHLSVQQLSALRTELEQLSPPPGAELAAFAQIKDSLGKMLDARGDGKGVRALPNQTKNTVADARVVDEGGTFTLNWTYRNVGDYGSNGEVGISDLTPLGSHLNKGESSPDWATAQAADGDGNKLITLADLTPIGANLGAQISGYKIYGSQTAGGPWSVLLGEVELADASATYPRSFSFGLGATPPPFILLSAYDASGEDWQDGIDPVPAQVNLGTDIPDTNTTVVTGNVGVLIGTPGTPLEGYSVDIPSTAFDIDTQVALGYNDGTITPVLGTQLGPIINLTTDFGQGFQDPVEITVPYSGNADELPVPFYLDPDMGLRLCDIVDLDPVAGTMTFNTWHASSFAVILAIVSNPLADFYDTKFDPKLNGFQIVNTGSQYNLDGECLGMTAFAAFYYRTQYYYGYEPTKLYPKFMAPVGTSGMNGQQVIASRAYNSINRGWDAYYETERWQWTQLTDTQQWLCLRIALLNTADPVLVSIRNEELGKAHSVLAFAWVEDDLFIYDPNKPGQSPAIHFDTSIKKLDDYGIYDQFAASGDGSLAIKEPFELILNDAEGNFAGSSGATITFTPPSDSTVSSEQVNTVVHIESGAVLVDKITLSKKGYGAVHAVPQSGNLNFNTLVKPGDNYFQVRTYGKSARGSEIPITNNFSNTRGYHLVGDIDVPVLRVEVTWDTSTGVEPGHIDLAVHDPFGGGGGNWRSTHEGNQIYPSGGELTAAGLESGGPQVYILESTDDVAYGQFYQIRTHFKPTTTWSELTTVTMKIWINGIEPQQSNGTLLNYTDWNWNDGSEPEYVGPETQSVTLGWIGGANIQVPAL
ncbi:MAG: hypothetical protein M3R04_00395 [bacterium]|nr:hypothetical protein [bacterium]